jgi:prolipoprotein diacylglyceryltransferase
MRRDHLWYGIAVCWGIAAAIGLLRHHAQEALPALFFAIAFALVGVWIGKRDRDMHRRRSAGKQ